MQLTIRKIEDRDIPEMINLVHEAWFDGFNEKEEFEKAAAAISLNKALYNSSTGRVAEVDGQILGMILCKITKDDPEFRKFQTNTIENLIELSKHGQEEEINRLIKTFEAEKSIYNQFLGEVDTDYDASIEYIAVSSKARGHGLGKSLIYEAIKDFKNEDCQNLYLFTDSDCNYRFYDYLDFEQVTSDTIQIPTKNGTRARQEFMYAYQFM